MKRNYNSRYKFYTELLKIYNKNPKIIKKIYTKLNAIKDLNRTEKKLLSELIYYNNKLDKATGGSVKGGGVLYDYKESKMKDVLKKTMICPIYQSLIEILMKRN